LKINEPQRKLILNSPVHAVLNHAVNIVESWVIHHLLAT